METSSVDTPTSTSHSAVGELVRREVPDWDDEVLSLARFKAFTGQRSDWEHRYLFWRDLILKIARVLGVCTVTAFEVKNVWFVRGGLTPLCIDQVLMEMHSYGEIILKRDLVDPKSGRLNRMIKNFTSLVRLSSKYSPVDDGEGYLVLKALLQDKAKCIIKTLSENHWTSHCIITLEKFQIVCKISNEADAILSYLIQSGMGQYFSIRKMDFIEGIKISLSQRPVSNISTLDYDILHLVWTTERLQRQLDALDRRWLMSRKFAVASVRSGNKEAAYRYIRQTKLFAESRNKCTSFLERVEEVTSLILNTETTRKVSEAIDIGARAITANKISAEEVHRNLQEFDESISSLKEIEDILGSTSLQCVDIEDEDLEEEFNNLEEELGREALEKQLIIAEEMESKGTKSQGATDIPCEGEVLSQSFSKLNLEPA